MPSSKKSRGDDRIKEVLQRAMSLDRRRQAQINNQVASINRLLEQFDEGKHAGTSHAAYTEEMRVLHEGAAAFAVENEDLRTALSDLVRAIDALHLDQLTVAGRDTDLRPYFDALTQARALIGLSEPVSASGSAEG